VTAAAADRGKSAEKVVHGVLDGFNERVKGFTFNRVPDAHAAGGRFPAQAGDFQAFRKMTVTIHPHEIGQQFEPISGFPMSRNFIIEVKEVKIVGNASHNLPAKNYDAGKVGRVQKRVWAGTEAIVVIRFMPMNVWRAVPFEVFTTRPVGSWKLEGYPVVDLETALAGFMGIS
jgi:hypothetical protein